MLFIVIIGLIVCLLAIGSIMSARQTGQRWSVLAGIAVVSSLVTIIAIIKLPYWPTHQKATPALAAKTVAPINTVNKTPTVFNEDQKRQQVAATRLKVTHALHQIQANYHDLGQVSVNRQTQTFIIKPTDARYQRSLVTMQAQPQQNETNINKVVTNYQALSRSVKRNVIAGYTVTLLQPHSHKTLLAVKDGQVMQNKLK